MKTINTIDELAATMFEVHHMAEPLGNPQFCASMVSCAVTIAARDGLTDKQVVKMIVETATSALVVVRAREELQQAGFDPSNLEVH